MEPVEIISLSAAVLVVPFLIWFGWRILQSTIPQAEPRQPGHGIDASELTTRIQAVRSDFPSALHIPKHDAAKRRALLATARHVVELRAYFHWHEEPVHHDAAHS